MPSEKESGTDVVELVALLQCLGFNVKTLNTGDANLSQDEGLKTVVINCQSSGLHVVLESTSAACSCPPADHHNSGFWQVSGMSGNKRHDKESGSALLGSLTKQFKDRLKRELQNLVKSIKDNNESTMDFEKHDKSNGIVDGINKSTSMVELKTTPEQRFREVKADTPTRYRSLDTLTNTKECDHFPPPGNLVKCVAASDTSNDDVNGEIKRVMCQRQSTYTVSSTPGSSRRRNKTSSPIQTCSSSTLDDLIATERLAEELRSKLAKIIKDYGEEANHDTSVSSLALDVSKISLLKGADGKNQFASSPNLSGLCTLHEDVMTKGIRRFESVSTSNLVQDKAKDSGSKISKLRRLSPSFFKLRKGIPSNNKDLKTALDKTPKSGLVKPRIVTPVRVTRVNSEASPNLSSSKKKYSHIKSTIPKPCTRKE